MRSSSSSSKRRQSVKARALGGGVLYLNAAMSSDAHADAAPMAKKAKMEDKDAIAMETNENVPPDAGSGNVNAESVKRSMREYYQQFYPADLMYKWLAYGHDGKHAQVDKSFTNRREFCFTLDGDIFARYQNFPNAKEFRAGLARKVPSKIDIGPVFNRKPSERHGVDFKPVERELVFDIDMTDYDDVRTCCSEANICGKCWPLMTVAIKVLDVGLRKDFGFKHLLWVYSGRRGVHCWVSDERARKLSDEARSAVAEYFAVYKGTDASGAKRLSLTTPLHPSLKRAYNDVLKKYWTEVYLPAQKIFEHEDKYTPILDSIQDEDIRSELESAFKRSGTDSVARWELLETLVTREQAKVKRNYKLDGILEKIVFGHIYPRLDIEVSRHMNHLLKAPFCIHPKTGRVCVPMDPETCEKFDFEQVPTVLDLISGTKSLNESTELFTEKFWKALDVENEAKLTSKTREVKAANQSGMDF